MSKIEVTRTYYSVAEVAQHFNVTRQHVLTLITRGELPAIRMGKRIFRVPVSAVRAFAESRKVQVQDA